MCVLCQVQQVMHAVGTCLMCVREMWQVRHAAVMGAWLVIVCVRCGMSGMQQARACGVREYACDEGRYVSQA